MTMVVMHELKLGANVWWQLPKIKCFFVRLLTARNWKIIIILKAYLRSYSLMICLHNKRENWYIQSVDNFDDVLIYVLTNKSVREKKLSITIQVITWFFSHKHYESSSGSWLPRWLVSMFLTWLFNVHLLLMKEELNLKELNIFSFGIIIALNKLWLLRFLWFKYHRIQFAYMLKVHNSCEERKIVSVSRCCTTCFVPFICKILYSMIAAHKTRSPVQRPHWTSGWAKQEGKLRP